MPIAKTAIPGHFSDDDRVQAFCTAELWNIGPYSQPEHVMGGRELFQAARETFGDLACFDLEYWLH
ncbi:hypothetical protein [Bradyrhizobium sp. AUGA SZCCT0042]|uniref:hypothetical protein n=1 Tax=Bradyrhizobium sp. AUGA SZCCT0042 TaxID=2807651 RepID=UPI001BA797FC|nr:hypothetical protein [Bradyrhizobium sp. AUGA SZCCT0042]MBR1298545.1 hypothetical protein [Bradyrhizobium sp. AUGA SZCCT0042]